jgi:hypothetical protein
MMLQPLQCRRREYRCAPRMQARRGCVTQLYRPRCSGGGLWGKPDDAPRWLGEGNQPAQSTRDLRKTYLAMFIAIIGREDASQSNVQISCDDEPSCGVGQ